MNIVEAALSAAWAMEEAALNRLLEIAAREHEVTPEALEAYRAKSLENADRATVRDGVAVLDVRGPLFKRANMFTAISGATSYDTLRRDLQTSVDDSQIRAILLNVDSPGGEASGVGELALAIREVRGVKPIVAYAGDLAASAGYWIASAADRIIVGEGAALGSIGVRAAYSDTSARDTARGIKTVEFVSSQSPFKAADLKTKDGKARIQARVDSLAQVFVEAVAANRDVSVAKVLDAFGKGDVLIGKAAVSAGMADGIGTFESVLAGLSRETDPLAAFGLRPAAETSSTSEQVSMTPEEHAAAIEAAKAEARAEALAEAQAASATASQAATEAAQTAERARVAELMSLAPPGYEKERDEAIGSGSSPAAFSALILAAEKVKRDARAAATAADTAVNSTVKPGAKVESVNAEDALVASIVNSAKLARGE